MVSWEIVHRATVFIAEEMGSSLKRSAFSPNIRERMDHSCAIVDEKWRIVAQAEHIPVHLGSFRVGVRNLLEFMEREEITLEEGDMMLVNDPYISGTHMNDVMVLAPVMVGGKTQAYVVNKAHHVDVGGPIPGSLNPSAVTLYEEGVVIPPVKVMKRGEMNRDVVSVIRENFKTPSTAMGDLSAQIASNLVGQRRVKEIFEKYGVEEVRAGWDRSVDYSREMVTTEIGSWGEGVFRAEDYLEWRDSLLPIRVSLNVKNGNVEADFGETSQQIEGPLNAVLGVTYSAVSFAVRSMITGDVPTNEGFYQSVSVLTRRGTLLDPERPAAVAGGNVETSQRVADVTFLALAQALPGRVTAAAHGTMMNIMMGGRTERGMWSYYETMGGGSGARPNGDGEDAVHVNMSNTLNTPIEVAERQYPMFFLEYSIRRGSGGEGRYRGGNGIRRRFKLTERARFSIIADRFRLGPWGLEGGGRGHPGRAKVNDREIDSKVTVELNPGDVVTLESPGGGGYGKVDRDSTQSK